MERPPVKVFVPDKTSAPSPLLIRTGGTVTDVTADVSAEFRLPVPMVLM